jgi:segregation and condensation protein B
MTEATEKMIKIIEAILFTAGEPLSIERIQTILSTHDLNNDENDQKNIPENIISIPQTDNLLNARQIRIWLNQLSECYQNRAVELVEVAGGFRFQAKQDYVPWIQRLFEKKPPRYSRTLLETLALIVYRQPITRGEIGEIRGVTVNSQVIKTLTERGWIKIVGTRDVPGKPVLLGTTKQFLDDFNLKNLAELPPLEELTDLDAVGGQLEIEQLEIKLEPIACS